MYSYKIPNLRVLQVIGNLCRGGIETWLMRILPVIQKQQIQFDFACIDPSGESPYTDEAIGLGARVIPCSREKSLFSFAISFSRLLAEGRYDIVHCHDFFSAIALPIARVKGVAGRIAHIHPLEDVAGRTGIDRRIALFGVVRAINMASNCIVSPSEASLRAFLKRGVSPRHLSCIVPNAVNLEAYSKPCNTKAVRKMHGLPLDKFLIVYTARFFEHKNHKQVFRIADQFLKSLPNVHFVLIGSHGPLKGYVIQEAVKRVNVSVLEAVDDVSQILLASNMFFFPSLNEGFGVVAVEAAAAGLPIVASDLSSIREALCPEMHVLTFSPDSDGEAITKIRRVLDDEHLRTRVSTLGRQWSNRFSIERSVQMMVNVYRELLKSVQPK